MKRKKILISGFIFFFLSHNLQAETNFQFTTDSNPDSQHEIEFFKSKENQQDSEVIQFDGNQYKASVNSNFGFFRVRRIGDHDAKGFWSEI